MRGIRVLAVDDEELTLKLVRTIVEEPGVEISACTRAQQALELMLDKQFAGEPFDLLITDLDMPGERGTVLIKAVRELEIQAPAADRKRLPIILLTAEDPEALSELEKDDLMQLGIIYMSKAAMVEELSPAVKKAVGR